MNPIYNFSIDGHSFHMHEDTIRAMENNTDSKIKAIYDAGIQCIQEYKEAEQEWREIRKEEQDEIDFAWENDMLDDLSEHY